MSRNSIIGTVIALFIAIFAVRAILNVEPDEIENAPDWLTLEQAFDAIATEQGEQGEKLILIDIYEIGCQYCRKMEREVYPSESIRTLIDRSFIPVKVNGNSDTPLRYRGESMTEQQFASLVGVTAFPYTVVMDREGNVLNTRRGYMGIADLSRFLNTTLREYQSALTLNDRR